MMHHDGGAAYFIWKAHTWCTTVGDNLHGEQRSPGLT
jgi:hypothetical protein